MACKYDKEYDKEEREAFEWLQEVLKAIIEKGPKHRSYQKAMALDRAMTKLDDHCVELHGAAHAMESRIMMFVEAQMNTQPWGNA